MASQILSCNRDSHQAVATTLGAFYKYLHSDGVEFDETTEEFLATIRSNIIGLPASAAEEIKDFATELTELLTAEDGLLSSCQAEDIGYMNDDGLFEIKNEEGAYLMVCRYWEGIFTAERIVDDFTKRVLFEYAW